MHASVKRVEGLTFVGKADSNHWVPMDGKAEHGGSDSAPSPKELVLMGLAGCTAFDVEGILRKRRLDVRSLSVEADADLSVEHPRVFTEVRLDYRIEGTAATSEVERAIRLSQEKYCAVSAMLRKAVPIRWRAFVNGVEVASGAEGEAAAETRATPGS
jgi:putative redox protein